MRRINRVCVAAMAALLVIISLPAISGSAFDRQAFEAAQHSGKRILIDVTASWCPTCQVQRPILAKLADEPAFRDFVVLSVDFDTQKDIVRALGARTQSMLIVFRGETEIARSVGETDEGSIRTMMDMVRTR